MKRFLFIVAAAVILAACSNTGGTEPLPTAANEVAKPGRESAPRLIAAQQRPKKRPKPDSHFPSHARDCTAPVKNCLDGVHILEWPPKLAAQINSLEAAILNGSQRSFFADPSNYDELWTAEVNRCISDLRSGSAVLVVVPSSSQSFRQYALMNAVTGEAMDYSDVD